MTKRDAKTMRECYKAYNKIYTIDDLNRRNMTLAEYNVLRDVLQDVIGHYQSSETIMQRVADWCRAHGLVVKEQGIGWVISPPVNS